MEYSSIDLWLQRFYWVSQILLPFIAVVAGWIALKQAWTFRLFELLRHIEQPRVRSARAIVMREISMIPSDQEWWVDGRLHDAAATFCSAYDHLGGIIKFHGSNGRVERFFIERWGETVVRSYLVLTRFLEFRRKSAPNSYDNYIWLYKLARQHFPDTRQPKPPTPTAASN